MATGTVHAQSDGGDVNAVAYDVDHLTFSYAAQRRRLAHEAGTWTLKDFCFSIAAGDMLGIIGPNGSGKSTLLKLLAAILVPQQGTIRLQGRPLDFFSRAALARLVAYVPQQGPVAFPFTIAELVLMGRFPHRDAGGALTGFGWETAEDIRVAEEAMEAMEILPLADRPIGEVSGGERQRALIARALAQAPRILLLDEPTVFLDLRHQADICAILRRLNVEQGLTVVMVSHDLNVASQSCGRVLLLKDGSMVRLGSPAEVIRPDVIEAVYRCPVLVDRHPASGAPRVTLP